MADFTKPATTDLYTALLTAVRDNFADQAKLFDGASLTSAPTGAKRWNDSAKRFEKWNGSAWAEMVPKASDKYDINVDRLDGADAGNASGNVALSNGTLCTNLNADMLDGLHAAAFPTLAGSNTFTGAQAFGAGINVYHGGLLSLWADNGRIVRPNQTGCHVKLASGVGLANGETKLTMTTEVHQVGSAYSTSTGRFTAPLTGQYLVSAMVGHSGGTANTGQYGYRIKLNGTSYVENYTAKGGNYGALGWSGVVYLAAGDYLELYGILDSMAGTITAEASRCRLTCFLL